MKKKMSEMTPEEQLEEGIGMAKRFAQDHFDPFDDELPCGMALATKDSKTNEILDEPGIVFAAFDPEFFSSSEMKRNLIKSIQKITEEYNAIFMVLMFRAWAAPFDPDSKKNIRPSQHEERTEKKMLVVQHRTLGTSIHVANITKDSDGKASLSDFRKMDSFGEGLMVGSFFKEKIGIN